MDSGQGIFLALIETGGEGKTDYKEDAIPRAFSKTCVVSSSSMQATGCHLRYDVSGTERRWVLPCLDLGRVHQRVVSSGVC